MFVALNAWAQPTRKRASVFGVGCSLLLGVTVDMRSYLARFFVFAQTCREILYDRLGIRKPLNSQLLTGTIEPCGNGLSPYLKIHGVQIFKWFLLILAWMCNFVSRIPSKELNWLNLCFFRYQVALILK